MTIACCFHASIPCRYSRMLCQNNHCSSGQNQDSPSSPEPPLQTSGYQQQTWNPTYVYFCVFCRSETTVLLFLGVFATLKAVPQKEGFIGLYKGNGAMMVRIFPYGAIQFMAFENYKKVPYTLDIVYVKVSLVLRVICHEAFMILLHLFIFYGYIGCFLLVKTLTFVSSLVICLISSSFFLTAVKHSHWDLSTRRSSGGRIYGR